MGLRTGKSRRCLGSRVLTVISSHPAQTGLIWRDSLGEVPFYLGPIQQHYRFDFGVVNPVTVKERMAQSQLGAGYIQYLRLG